LVASVFLVSCGPATERITIEFSAQHGSDAVACGTDAPVQLTDLRLYLSDVRVLDQEGNSAAVVLDEDGFWQQHDLALLDFEDGQGACSNGTTATNIRLSGRVRSGSYEGLRFTVGVPFDGNHSDPLTALPPMGDAAMHWHWRGGYKFLRAGVATAGDNHWLHLGSTGCEGTIGNISGCRAPNRVVVLLTRFRLDRNTVVIDLSKLFPYSDLTDGVAGSCSSGPAEQGCDTPFAALGLSHRGRARDGLQAVFRTGVRQ
jgi:uncharacterized repeat protein (TIGR04052 family)